MTLDDAVIASIAEELAEADRTHGVIPRITARHPHATVEDSYAIQGVWRDRMIARGRRLVGRKIGLTSKAMQQATGITEPDYGVMFDDTVYRTGAEIPVDLFSNVRIEVELAFVLKHARRTRLHARRRPRRDRLRRARARGAQFAHRARGSHDRRHDQRQRRLRGHGARRRAQAPRRDRPALGARRALRNGEIEETGVAAGVLGHPAAGVAWLADKFAQHGARLEAGEIILAGSFTRPMWVSRGDIVHCDYGPMGTITCSFV